MALIAQQKAWSAESAAVRAASAARAAAFHARSLRVAARLAARQAAWQTARAAESAAVRAASALRSAPALDRIAARRRIRDEIRRGQTSIGGYACLFGPQLDVTGKCSVLSAEPFFRAISTDRLCLLLDHQGNAVARQDDGTFYAEVDGLGLWVEARLAGPRLLELFSRIGRGDVGFSTGHFQPVGKPMAEVSLIVPPNLPRRFDTWCLQNAMALSKRREWHRAAGVPFYDD